MADRNRVPFAFPTLVDRIWTVPELTKEIEGQLPNRNTEGIRECLEIILQGGPPITDQIKKTLFSNLSGAPTGSAQKDAWQLRTNLINICSKNWFFGALNRTDAHHQISGQPIGTFLVRYLPTTGEFQVTSRDGPHQVSHRRLTRHGYGWATYFTKPGHRDRGIYVQWHSLQTKTTTVDALVSFLVFKGEYKYPCPHGLYWTRPPRHGQKKSLLGHLAHAGQPLTKGALFSRCSVGTLLGNIPQDLQQITERYCKWCPLIDGPSLKPRYIYEFKSSIGSKTSINPIEMGKPTRVAIDMSGILYILDKSFSRIHVFRPNGEYIRSIGRPQDIHEVDQEIQKKGVLVQPRDILIDHYGNLAVLDLNRVQIFDPVTGECKITFTPFKAGTYEYDPVMCLDLDGNFIIPDHNRHRLQVYTPFGTKSRKIGSYGNRPGHFNRPTCVACDGKNNLYVGEIGNRRIQILDSLRKPLRMISPNQSLGVVLPTSLLGKFFPVHLSVDKNGAVVCVDKYTKKVQIYSQKGELEIGSVVTLADPEGTAIDAEGRLLIVDQALQIYG